MYYVIVDVSGYAQSYTDINDPLGIEVTNPEVFVNLVLPKHTIDGIFEEGFGTATITQKLTWFNGDINAVNRIGQMFFFGSVQTDIDGKLGVTNSITKNITYPMFITPVPDNDQDGVLTTTGSGQVDVWDLEINPLTHFEYGKLWVDPKTELVFGEDRLDSYLIDINNILGFGANFIIHQFITNFRIFAGVTQTFDDGDREVLPIMGGLFIRLEYTAGPTSPPVKFIPFFKWRR